jgi:hypothetical protein
MSAKRSSGFSRGKSDRFTEFGNVLAQVMGGNSLDNIVSEGFRMRYSLMNKFYRNASIFLWNEGCNVNSILK